MMTNKPKDLGGRPTDYTQELADLICSELAEGKSMRTVCALDGMPDKSTIFRWIRLYEEFRDQYTKAKEEGVEAWAEESIDIADNGSNDWMLTHDKDNDGYKVNGEHIQRSRLRIETRKWYASKLKPKKYGDRQQIDLTDKTDKPDEEELDARISQLIARQNDQTS